MNKRLKEIEELFEQNKFNTPSIVYISEIFLLKEVKRLTKVLRKLSSRNFLNSDLIAKNALENNNE